MSIAIKVGLIAIDTDVGVDTKSANASTNNYDSFEKPIGTKYQVPLGKVFKIGKVIYTGSTVNAKITIGYGDTSVENDSTPPTNAVELLPLIPIETAKKLIEMEIYLKIPSEKYPFVRASGGIINSVIVGIEE